MGDRDDGSGVSAWMLQPKPGAEGTCARSVAVVARSGAEYIHMKIGGGGVLVGNWLLSGETE